MANWNRRQLFSVVALLLATCAHGVSTNCTIPTSQDHFVGAPSVRGTLDILWTCLATIITCTYSALHLRVPYPESGRTTVITTSIIWAIVTVLAPEMILTFAISVILGARKELRLLHEQVPSTYGTWTLTHVLFAAIGGFSLRHGSSDRQTETPNTALVAQTSTFKVTPESLRNAMRQGWVPESLPTSTEIMDRSKADLFTKVLTIGQTLYFLIAVITRVARRIPVSQLEVGVCGFVVCAAVVYACHIMTPKAVATESVLGTFDGKLAAFRECDQANSRARMSMDLRDEIVDNISFVDLYKSYPIVLAVSGVLLGCVHLSAWNLDFPTPIDAWLWRTAALASTVAMPLVAISLGIAHTRGDGSVEFLLILAISTIYAISRLILVIEMFRTLFYLPPEAYLTTWTRNIPHLG